MVVEAVEVMLGGLESSLMNMACKFITKTKRSELRPNDDIKSVLFNSKRDDTEIGDVNDCDSTSSNSQRRIGKITHISSDGGEIDKKYYFDKNLLSEKNVKVGQAVKFLIYRPNLDVSWMVKSISVLNDDDWSNESNDIVESIVTSENRAVEEVILTEVVNRDGRRLTFKDGLTADMDKIKCEFSPMIGDLVSLGALVEYDKKSVGVDTRIVIEVLSMKAPRRRNLEGKITHLNKDNDLNEFVGLIANEAYFTSNVCDHGYIPKKDDLVVARVIESQQGTLCWRAINVLLIETCEGDSLESKINEERLFDGKNGVVLNVECAEKALKIGKSTSFKVVVQNSSRNDYKVNEIIFKHSKLNGAMKLDMDIKYPVLIPSMQCFNIKVNATASHVGNYTEVLVVNFEGNWSIGALLEIQVDVEDEFNELLKRNDRRSNKINTKKIIEEKRLNAIKKLTSPNEGYVIAGRPPFRPAAFVPKKIPLYTIPQNFKELMVAKGDILKKLPEIKEDLQKLLPTMIDELNENNYTFKFHYLLHLEDLETLISIKKYDTETACFTKQDDFLVMEIKNLAESRPSLVVGDKVEATDPSLAADCVKKRSEGYIHKVLQHSIKLKFNEAFHNTYDGRFYSLTFIHSRTSIRRCHMGVDEVMKHLKGSWLFPDSIGQLKLPQVNVIGEHPAKEMQEESMQTHTCIVQKVCANKKKKKEDCETINFLDALSDSEESEVDLEEDRETMTNEKAWQNAVHSYKMMDRNFDQKPIDFDDENLRNMGRPQSKSVNTVVKKDRMQCRDVILKWVNKSLNYFQKEAVRNILKGEARPLPYIIFGPPGTGKTVTVVEAILQIIHLIPESRILVTAPSNSSADLICERLLSWHILKPGDLIRLVGYNYMIDKRMSDLLVPYCTCIDTKNLDKMSLDVVYDEDGVKYSPRALVGMHKITVSTCASAGNLYSMGFPKNHFTHIIVDEAGQATEPEIMVPFAFLDYDGHAILAGDPLQLGPVITSRVADSMGLGESFLSRLHIRFPYHRDPESFPDTDGYDSRLVTRLLYNYRAVPTILELYSSLFYESKLIPKICASCSDESKLVSRLKEALQTEASQIVHSIIFHGIKGRNIQETDSPSWYNAHEVARVVQYVMMIYNAGISVDDIGIVTPYQKQVIQIREMLRNTLKDVSPKIGSVEEFQGQERKIIIMSTVRSDRGLLDKDRKFALGFVSSKQRVNVAISRARALLIIVGNPHLLSLDCTWRNLIKICYKKGYYVGCDLPQSITSNGL